MVEISFKKARPVQLVAETDAGGDAQDVTYLTPEIVETDEEDDEENETDTEINIFRHIHIEEMSRERPRSNSIDVSRYILINGRTIRPRATPLDDLTTHYANVPSLQPELLPILQGDEMEETFRTTYLRSIVFDVDLSLYFTVTFFVLTISTLMFVKLMICDPAYFLFP